MPNRRRNKRGGRNRNKPRQRSLSESSENIKAKINFNVKTEEVGEINETKENKEIINEKPYEENISQEVPSKSIISTIIKEYTSIFT